MKNAAGVPGIEMSIATPTYQELLSYAEKVVRERTGITNFSESSVAGALLKIYCQYLSDTHSLIEELDERTNLSTAIGADLDKIGELYGITRLPSKKASTTGYGNTVLFRNNGDASTTIPIGTRIWSDKDVTVSFLTTSAVTIAAGSEGYANVEAIGYGGYFNVGPNSLNSHDLGNTSITVTNVIGIQNGTDAESDDNYRYRISNAFNIARGSTEEAIRLKLLEIPEVKEAYIHPLVRGTGTIDIIITSVNSVVSDTLIAQAQDVVDDIVALGISAIVKAPVEIPVDVQIVVTLSSQLEATTARSIASASLRSYIDNLPVGDTAGNGKLVFYELVSRVMDAHKDIQNVDIRLQIDGQPSLNVDYAPNVGEKFYVRSIEVL